MPSNVKQTLDLLFSRAGTYLGEGTNHEGQKFTGTLKLHPSVAGKGLTLDFVAVGKDGIQYHREHSLVGLNPAESLSLWVLSTNHPGVVEHKLHASEGGLVFRCGDFVDQRSFREEIAIDFWDNGDLGYRYSWGLPGGEFQERSSVRMPNAKTKPIREAKLKKTDHGLVPEGEGWYVINARESRWNANSKFGTSCGFEGTHRFEQFGMNVHVIHPGQPNCHYHGEDDQEDFLVVQGECRLLIEGEERLLKPWDFVHCPKWAKHVFVGTGKEPCAIVMVGGRTGHGVIYPVTELVKRYDACPAAETDSPRISYAHTPAWAPAQSGLPL
jgi:uncharacterized cupin superfamily protein